MSAPILHSGSKFRHGLLQLLIHSIDPLHEHEGEANGQQFLSLFLLTPDNYPHLRPKR